MIFGLVSWFDFVNGSFEGIGGVLLWLNVCALYKAKEFKGVTIAPTAFFAAWGLWNLYYYPHLGQWFSFAMGCDLVLANLVWVGQMFYYSRPRPPRPTTCTREVGHGGPCNGFPRVVQHGSGKTCWEMGS